MENHVSKLCQILSFYLHSFFKIRKYLTDSACVSLVHALFTSKLDLNNTLLTGLPKYQIKRLQLLQNTAARIITKSARYCHITPILSDLHWLPIEFRIKFKLAVTVFKCLHNMAPKYLCDIVSKKVNTRTLWSSSKSNLLIVPRTKTKTGEKAFRFAGPKTWNDLPPFIINLDSLLVFKKELKTHYFKICYNM